MGVEVDGDLFVMYCGGKDERGTRVVRFVTRLRTRFCGR